MNQKHLRSQSKGSKCFENSSKALQKIYSKSPESHVFVIGRIKIMLQGTKLPLTIPEVVSRSKAQGMHQQFFKNVKMELDSSSALGPG